MRALLLRHVEAGDRAALTGDDRQRPVSEHGRRQAEALVGLLADHPVERVVSSPLLRCVQSVEPIAAARGLEINVEDGLAEGASLDAVRCLLRGLGERPALLCSHGDVIGAVITDLGHRGTDLPPSPRWPKASVWALTGDPSRPTAVFVPPPTVR